MGKREIEIDKNMRDILTAGEDEVDGIDMKERKMRKI